MKSGRLYIGLSLSGAILAVTGLISFAPRSTSVPPISPWRTPAEVFAIHRQQGWSVIRSPKDGKKYRIAGAVQDGNRSQTQSHIEGAFRLSDGRSVKFKFPMPFGAEIEVDGLEPDDGGDLQYAILIRSHGHRLKN